MATSTATNNITTVVLEHCHVRPLPDGNSLTKKSFPLSYFDMPWVGSHAVHPIHQLFFHEIPHPKSYLLDTTIPNLKHSLSITLQHFFPLAGNLILFPSTKKPEIHYIEGDVVSFTVAESKMDFTRLTKDHTRKSNQVYPLVPKLGDLIRDDSDNTIKVPLLAFQVTIFPSHGICIGITNHHVVGDAIASVNFIKAWGSVTKFGSDKPFVSVGSSPIFDKSIINDPNNINARIWSHISKTRSLDSPPRHINGHDDMIRASFIMTKDQVNKVKKSILTHRPTISRVSTFTIVCAHVWSCMAKARDAIGVLDKRELALSCVAECRARLDSPLPSTYFGNCVVALEANAKHDQLVGKEGFFDAVELIGNAIRERIKSRESIDAGIDPLVMIDDRQSFGFLMTTVAGSLKVNFYDTDFGWGRPVKYHLVSMDYSSVISLNLSRESEQDIGIELSLPKIQMDVLQTIFANALNKIIF